MPRYIISVLWIFWQMHTMGKPDHIKQEFPSEEAEFEAVPRNMDTLQTVSGFSYMYNVFYMKDNDLQTFLLNSV